VRSKGAFAAWAGHGDVVIGQENGNRYWSVRMDTSFDPNRDRAETYPPSTGKRAPMPVLPTGEWQLASVDFEIPHEVETVSVSLGYGIATTADENCMYFDDVSLVQTN